VKPYNVLHAKHIVRYFRLNQHLLCSNFRESMAKIRLSILLLTVTCLAVLTHGVALYGPQVVDGPDVKIHYRWALQFASAISDGIWYPRWAAYSYQGLGDPSFLYIHPLFYYATAAAYSLCGNIWLAILSVGALSSALTAAATYWVARRHTSVPLALTAAAAMALSPYAFHLAHYQQFLPMHFAMPMLVLFLGIVSLDHTRYRIPLTAGSLALLVMSHVLAAFMALVCTSVLVLWRAARLRPLAVRLLLEHGTGVVLGLALSAIYLLPALTAQGLISPTGWYQPIHLDWRNSFLLQYFSLPAFGFRWFHLQWTIPLLTVLVCGLSTTFLLLGRPLTGDGARKALEMLVLAILALALGSELSYPFWEHSSILQRLQFPLRFLQVASIASVFALIWSASCIVRLRAKLVWVSLVLFLGGSAAMLGALERQFATEAKPAEQIASPGKVQRGQPEMKPATAGDAWQAYVQAGGWQADCRMLGLVCVQVSENSHHRLWAVETATLLQSFRLPIFWFPGWEFRVNGELADPEVEPSTGLPMVALNQGGNTIEATWTGIPQERIGKAISLAALLLVIGLSIMIRMHSLSPGGIDVA